MGCYRTALCGGKWKTRNSTPAQMHFLQTHFGLDIKAKQHYAAVSTLQTHFWPLCKLIMGLMWKQNIIVLLNQRNWRIREWHDETEPQPNRLSGIQNTSDSVAAMPCKKNLQSRVESSQLNASQTSTFPYKDMHEGCGMIEQLPHDLIRVHKRVTKHECAFIAHMPNWFTK